MAELERIPEVGRAEAQAQDQQALLSIDANEDDYRDELRASAAENDQLHDRLDEMEADARGLREELARLKAALSAAQAKQGVYKLALEDERTRTTVSLSGASVEASTALEAARVQFDGEKEQLMEMLKEARTAAI